MTSKAIKVSLILNLLTAGSLFAQAHNSTCKNIRHIRADKRIYLSTDYGETWHAETNPDFLARVRSVEKLTGPTLLQPLTLPTPSSLIWQTLFVGASTFDSSLIVPQSIYQDNDGSLVLSGDISFVKFFLKTDEFGRELYRSTFSNQDTAIDIAVASKSGDTGYYFVGKKNSYFLGGFGEGLLCRITTDKQMNVTDFTYHYSQQSELGLGYSYFIKAENESYYSIVTNRTKSTKCDSLIVTKSNSDGFVDWVHPYYIGTNVISTASPIIQTHDGNLVFGVKRTHPNDTGRWIGDCMIFKTDNDGNLIWSKTIEFGLFLTLNSITETKDGNILLVGDAFDGMTKDDVYTALLNPDGNILWQRTFGLDQYTYIHPIATTAYTDGSFIIGGAIGDYHATVVGNNRNNWDMYLAKIDAQGNPLWQHTWGVDGAEDEILKLVISHDNKIIVLGETGVLPFSGGNMYLAKLNDEAAGVSTNSGAEAEAISLYPNPCSDLLNIVGVSDNVLKIEIDDLMGRVIQENSAINQNSVLNYNTEKLVAGTYFLKVFTSKNIITKPFTVVR
ncbi:MAG: T9SS type A sorting domain-containing protein [Ignavibacteriota bacterium]